MICLNNKGVKGLKIYELNEKIGKILEKVPVWQENYVAKLNQEYIELLQRNPSKNFWNAE